MGYIFNPEQIHEIACKAVGLSPEEMTRVVTDELDRAWPGRIATTNEWIFSLFGGTTSVLKVLYASITEYVILFGTPNGTTGFSGRFAMEIYDTVIAGEMCTFTEDQPLTRVITPPGEYARLGWFKSKGWGIAPESWMLEYGRGFVPSGIPFGVGDAFFSAMDPVTLGKTLWQYGRQAVRELLRGKI
jgi:C-8 sterol isomerase